MATTDPSARSERVLARFFGRDLASTGELGYLIVDGERIEAHVASAAITLALAEVHVREVGFGDAIGLELAWEGEGGVFAAHVLEPSALRSLRAVPLFAGLPQVRSLANARRRRVFGRTAGWLAVLTILLLPVIVLLVFISQANGIAAAIAVRVPLEQEARFGEAVFASLRPSLSLQESGPALAAVQEIGRRLAQGSQHAYRFHVAQDDSINAFALPGGIIVVHTGLIEATRRPEELAGVLAHEIEHVERRHSLRGAIKELGLRGLWALVTGDVGSSLLGQATAEVVSRKFSRDDESEADAGAVDRLVDARIDPAGMVEFFTTMSANASADAIPQFLSTHPADEERQRTLRERAALSDRQPFEPLAMQPWPPPLEPLSPER